MDFVLILAIGLVVGTLSGIVGFGSSIMLMPVLVIMFGPLPWAIVLKMDASRFRLLMDGLMLVSGVTLLSAAFL